MSITLYGVSRLMSFIGIDENEACIKLKEIHAYIAKYLAIVRGFTAEVSSRKRLLFLMETLRRTCTKAISSSTLSADIRSLSKLIIESIIADIQLQLKVICFIK